GEVADQEPRHGAEDASRAAVRDGAGEAAQRPRRAAQVAGGNRRPQREDPHLQLSAGSADRPPHRTDAPQSRRRDGRRYRGRDRRLPHLLPGGGAAPAAGPGMTVGELVQHTAKRLAAPELLSEDPQLEARELVAYALGVLPAELPDRAHGSVDSVHHGEFMR